MKPRIDNTSFGSITIEGKVFDHDVFINLNGEINKRKKKLSKKHFGTSHIISLEEAKHIYEEGVEKFLVGSGQTGMVTLSDEASEFLDQMNCNVFIIPTAGAIEKWNKESGSVIGLFHITC
ncbi:MAG: MTH938/NDUFAF3 family protein [Ignavibacteriaceae bacterium]